MKTNIQILQEGQQEKTKVKNIRPIFLIIIILAVFVYSVINLSVEVHAAETSSSISGNDITGIPKIDINNLFLLNFKTTLEKDQYDSLVLQLNDLSDSYRDNVLKENGVQSLDVPTENNITIFSHNLITTDYYTDISDSSTLLSSVYNNQYSHTNVWTSFGETARQNQYFCFVYDDEYTESISTSLNHGSKYYRLCVYDKQMQQVKTYESKSYTKFLNTKYSTLLSVYNTDYSTEFNGFGNVELCRFDFGTDFEPKENSDNIKSKKVKDLYCSVPVFDDRFSAIQYFRNGDAIGILNPFGYFKVENIDNPVDSDSKKIGDFHLLNVKCNKILSKLGMTMISWNGVSDDGWSTQVPNDDTVVIPTFYTYDFKGGYKIFGMEDLDLFKNFSGNLKFRHIDKLNDNAGFNFNWSDLYDELDKKGYLWDGDIWLTPVYLHDNTIVTGKPTIVNSYRSEMKQVVVDKDGSEVIKPINPNTGLVDDEYNPDTKPDKPSGGSDSDNNSNDASSIFEFIKDFIGNLPNFVKYFTNIFDMLLSWLGSLPAFINSAFSFLPYELRTMFYGVLLTICFVSFVKAVIK